MCVLGASEIIRQMKKGNIVISPFDKKQLNSNSYDVRLGDTLGIYTDLKLDVRRAPKVTKVIIPESGYELQPGRGYLGFTIEKTFCKGFVPSINGKSTNGRYFFTIHQTAGQGDNWFDGQWTLEMVVMFLPLTIYPGMRIGQVFFETMIGKGKYKGKYQYQSGPTAAIPLNKD